MVQSVSRPPLPTTVALADNIGAGPAESCHFVDQATVMYGEIGIMVYALSAGLFMYGLLTNDRHRHMDMMAAKMEARYGWCDLIDAAADIA